ncbi:DNA repair protein XRCC3 isoform X3 [Choloepus didactylus]|uniref:DNA repair protein XRCC3 isoform X3 n=1 Tax=Choloepus didactylus TaxID=27675 RepID=UPI00189F92A3|nr:DNA repair protein XRCC3 isoform X3 [Choloepus didactylus]
MDVEQLDLNPRIIAAVKRVCVILAGLKAVKEVLQFSGPDLQRLTRLPGADVQRLLRTASCSLRGGSGITAPAPEPRLPGARRPAPRRAAPGRHHRAGRPQLGREDPAGPAALPGRAAPAVPRRPGGGGRLHLHRRRLPEQASAAAHRPAAAPADGRPGGGGGEDQVWQPHLRGARGRRGRPAGVCGQEGPRPAGAGKGPPGGHRLSGRPLPLRVGRLRPRHQGPEPAVSGGHTAPPKQHLPEPGALREPGGGPLAHPRTRTSGWLRGAGGQSHVGWGAAALGPLVPCEVSVLLWGRPPTVLGPCR